MGSRITGRMRLISVIAATMPSPAPASANSSHIPRSRQVSASDNSRAMKPTPSPSCTMRVVVRRASHDQRGSALRRFPLSVSSEAESSNRLRG